MKPDSFMLSIQVDKEDTYYDIVKKFYDTYTDATLNTDPKHSLEDGMYMLVEELNKKHAGNR